MDLSIVIVNYKGKDKALNCLKSLFSADLSGLEYEILVVDNASGGGEAEEIKKAYPSIKLLESLTNLGMGGGNNLGIKASTGRFVLILNHDTVVGKKAIKTLYDYLDKNDKVAIVGPKLIYPDGELQFSCFREWSFLMPLYRRTFLGKFYQAKIDHLLMKDFNHQEIREVDWLMGSCLLVCHEFLDEVGGFDERYFMYFEDSDLCREARSRGYKVVYNPQAEVIHEHGRGSAKRPWYISVFFDRLAREHIKSWIKYFLKWRNKS